MVTLLIGHIVDRNARIKHKKIAQGFHNDDKSVHAVEVINKWKMLWLTCPSKRFSCTSVGSRYFDSSTTSVVPSTHESIDDGRLLDAIDLDFAPTALLTAANLAPTVLWDPIPPPNAFTAPSSICLDACPARTSGLRLNLLS
jgi:hypothetical protein